MKKFIDSTRYECYICGHKWIIRSTEMITDKQFARWMKEYNKEHIITHKEKK